MTSLSKNLLNKLVAQLSSDFTDVNFKSDSKFYWSAANNTVYHPSLIETEDAYSLLHELAHSRLKHKDFASDFELIRMEAEAWEMAEKIGKKYEVSIPKNYIESCLDTYRDWLYMRSLCPACKVQGSQQSPLIYRCFNCHATWSVTAHRFTRPYRRLNKTRTT